MKIHIALKVVVYLLGSNIGELGSQTYVCIVQEYNTTVNYYF